MAEYDICSGCRDVMTPRGTVCTDCAFPVKRDRQQYVEHLRAELACAQRTLRDRFAMGAFQAAVAIVRDSQVESPARLGLSFGTPGGDRIARLAYELADAMIAARRPFESSKG